MSSELRTIESENFIITEDSVEPDLSNNISNVKVMTKIGYRIGRIRIHGPDGDKGIKIEMQASQTLQSSDLRELADLLDQWNKLEKAK